MAEGALRLQNATIESNGEYFTIRTIEGKVANFQANSEKECEEWVRQLRSVIGKL